MRTHQRAAEQATPETPAQRVVRKLGGVERTAELAGTSKNWVYRWMWSGDGGTKGRIPQKAQMKLLDAAQAAGLSLEPADFF